MTDDIYPPEMGPTRRESAPPNEVNLRRATVARRVALMMLALYMVGSLALQSWTAVQDSPVIDRIEDCTQPRGECYERGQRQTAKVVGDINRVVVLAAACAATVTEGQSIAEREAAITTCITKRLAQPAVKP